MIHRFGFNSEGVKRAGEHLKEYVASTVGGDDGPMYAVLRDEMGQVTEGNAIICCVGRWDGRGSGS